MENLAEQLKHAKLKPSGCPIKDYSNPKLAGFLSDKEVSAYQSQVLDVNIEYWMEALEDETFPTTCCPLLPPEAQLLITIYEHHFRSNPTTEIDWRSSMTDNERTLMTSMTDRLQSVLDEFLKDGEAAFVKTSSRSAKDAPLFQKKLSEMYHTELSRLTLTATNRDDTEENRKITSLLKAAFLAMKVTKADEVLDMFVCSERIYQDMMLALQLPDRYNEHFVIRKFVDIDVDMEFRGFVFDNELTALSQYNFLIYSPRLVEQSTKLEQDIRRYFEENVRPKLMRNAAFPSQYVIDFAVCKNGEKIWVIELNPFLSTTDGALFSWEHERHLLEGKERFEMRLTTRPKPGANAMLSNTARQILTTMNAATS